MPVALLTHSSLGAAAKVVWMVSRLTTPCSPVGISGLATASGLARSTVYRVMAELSAAGWALDRPAERPTVPVPRTLLTNSKLGAQAKCIYGVLLLTPGFHHPGGQFTYDHLALQAQCSANTVNKAVTELANAEWIKIERKNRQSRVHFQLTFPGLEQGLNAVADAQRRLWRPNINYGETLMREYLSLLVDSIDFVDNGSPGFLRNPRTEELLQLDRFYPPDVGFEFNGPQHYRETKRFTAEQAKQQRERDYIKIGLCVTHGVSLVIVHPEDLTLTQMRRKVEGLLPLRAMSGDTLLIDFLEAESSGYRSWAATL